MRQLEAALRNQRAAVAGVKRELPAVDHEVLACPFAGAPLAFQERVLGTTKRKEKQKWTEKPETGQDFVMNLVGMETRRTFTFIFLFF